MVLTRSQAHANPVLSAQVNQAYNAASGSIPAAGAQPSPVSSSAAIENTMLQIVNQIYSITPVLQGISNLSARAVTLINKPEFASFKQSLESIFTQLIQSSQGLNTAAPEIIPLKAAVQGLIESLRPRMQSLSSLDEVIQISIELLDGYKEIIAREEFSAIRDELQVSVTAMEQSIDLMQSDDFLVIKNDAVEIVGIASTILPSVLNAGNSLTNLGNSISSLAQVVFNIS